MNGIEKITGRIEADAQEQAKAIAAEARPGAPRSVPIMTNRRRTSTGPASATV